MLLFFGEACSFFFIKETSMLTLTQVNTIPKGPGRESAGRMISMLDGL